MQCPAEVQEADTGENQEHKSKTTHHDMSRLSVQPARPATPGTDRHLSLSLPTELRPDNYLSLAGLQRVVRHGARAGDSGSGWTKKLNQESERLQHKTTKRKDHECASHRDRAAKPRLVFGHLA